jgi:hypothetical protein
MKSVIVSSGFNKRSRTSFAGCPSLVAFHASLEEQHHPLSPQQDDLPMGSQLFHQFGKSPDGVEATEKKANGKEGEHQCHSTVFVIIHGY